MNDKKQIIKAINDLTKALNKNTDAIKENMELSKLSVNTLEGGDLSELETNQTLGSINNPYKWSNRNKAYFQPNEIQLADGLGNPVTYKSTQGGVFNSSPNEVSESSVSVLGCKTITSTWKRIK